MNAPIRRLLVCSAVLTISVTIVIFGRGAPPRKLSGVPTSAAQEKLPDKEFTHPPEKPHDPTAYFFNFDQLDYYYRVPGEFTHRLTGDQYASCCSPSSSPRRTPAAVLDFMLHDTEEAHVLLEGTAQYRIGDKTFTVQAPYVAKVPAGGTAHIHQRRK